MCISWRGAFTRGASVSPRVPREKKRRSLAEGVPEVCGGQLHHQDQRLPLDRNGSNEAPQEPWAHAADKLTKLPPQIPGGRNTEFPTLLVTANRPFSVETPFWSRMSRLFEPSSGVCFFLQPKTSEANVRLIRPVPHPLRPTSGWPAQNLATTIHYS